MLDRRKLFTNIEWLGRTPYWKECVEVCGSPSTTDWWRSLKFFFNHPFVRGRRNQLSAAYCQFTIEALQELFQIDPGSPDDGYGRLRGYAAEFDKKPILDFKQTHAKTKGSSIKQQAFAEEVAVGNSVIHALTTWRLVQVKFSGEKTHEKKLRLTNDEDLLMVLDVLNLVSCPEKKNVCCYLKHMIESEGPQVAFDKLAELRGIGDKIASLLIRNIGIQIKESDRRNWDYKFAFPVDTWVRKLAKKLGCRAVAKDEEIKDQLIEECGKYGVDPLAFAAGLWYTGFHAVDILIDHCLNAVELASDSSPKQVG